MGCANISNTNSYKEISPARVELTIKAALRFDAAASVNFESENLESAKFTCLYNHLQFEDKPDAVISRKKLRASP